MASPLCDVVVRRTAELLLATKGSDLFSTLERVMDELNFPEDDDVVLDDVAVMVEDYMAKVQSRPKLTALERENLELKNAEKMMNRQVKQPLPTRELDGDEEWGDVDTGQLHAWNQTLNVLDLLTTRLQQASKSGLGLTHV